MLRRNFLLACCGWTTGTGSRILGLTQIHLMEQPSPMQEPAAGSAAAAHHVAWGPVVECVRHAGGRISGSQDRQPLDRQLAGASVHPHRGKLGGGRGDLLAGFDQASIERDHRTGHPEAGRASPHERAAGRAGPRHGGEVGRHQFEDWRRPGPGVRRVRLAVSLGPDRLAGGRQGASKGNFPYMKAVEVVGLANMIGVLDVIVKTLLIVGLGNLYASPSLVLLVKEFDPQNPVHSLLAVVNVMTFWLLAVRAIGLARLSGASVAKAALWVFGIWAAYTGLLVGLGALAQAAFKRMGGG